MSKLIILRGNSGSGKTTVAKKLREKMGEGTMLVSQDTIRREILKVKDTPGNPSTELIYDTAIYGKRIGFDVIIEGILTRERNFEMLKKLVDEFGDQAFVYYFDIPFDETLKRHSLKPNKHEFGEEEMRRWWNDKDFLTTPGEKIVTKELSQDEIVDMIYNDIS